MSHFKSILNKTKSQQSRIIFYSIRDKGHFEIPVEFSYPNRIIKTCHFWILLAYYVWSKPKTLHALHTKHPIKKNPFKIPLPLKYHPIFVNGVDSVRIIVMCYCVKKCIWELLNLQNLPFVSRGHFCSCCWLLSNRVNMIVVFPV